MDPQTLFPDLMTEPVSQRMREAARQALPAPGFRGRAGAVLFVRDGQQRLEYAFATLPDTLAQAASWRDVHLAQLQPQARSEALSAITVHSYAGGELPLEDFLQEAMFAQYPDRPLGQGGEALAVRKDQWRAAALATLRAPAVSLLERVAREDAGWRPIDAAEWWVGRPPAHLARFEGAFYAPRSSDRYLLSWILRGVDCRPARPIAQRPVDIPVLFADRDLLVVNKPAGLASVPGVRERFDAKTLLERTWGPLGVIHRLDLDTSGVLLFARSRGALADMGEEFRSGLVIKRYSALVAGVPEARSGSVRIALAPDPLDRPRQCAALGAKSSETGYETVWTRHCSGGAAASLVHLWPETGRTHQLRMHCAHAEGLACPILGDPFYGREGILSKERHPRMCLDMSEITFEHPATHEILHFESLGRGFLKKE